MLKAGGTKINKLPLRKLWIKARDPIATCVKYYCKDIYIYLFPDAAVTNYHKAGDLKLYRNLFSRSSGDQKSKIKIVVKTIFIKLRNPGSSRCGSAGYEPG